MPGAAPAGSSRVDRFDPGMSVRRPVDHSIRLAGQIYVVAKTAFPGYQPQVFLAADRLSDPGTAYL